jgi:hypothetical protein
VDVDPTKLPNGKRVTDYHNWELSGRGGRADVDSSPKAQRVVRAFCYEKQREGPSLLISGGMTEDQALKTLGEPMCSAIIRCVGDSINLEPRRKDGGLAM